MEAPQPFTYVEIQAWCHLADRRLAPWELDAVMDMDVARRNALYETRDSGETPQNLRRTVSFRDQAEAERLFDSMGTVIDVEE